MHDGTTSWFLNAPLVEDPVVPDQHEVLQAHDICYYGHTTTSARRNGKICRQRNPANSFWPGEVASGVRLCSRCYHHGYRQRRNGKAPTQPTRDHMGNDNAVPAPCTFVAERARISIKRSSVANHGPPSPCTVVSGPVAPWSGKGSHDSNIREKMDEPTIKKGRIGNTNVCSGGVPFSFNSVANSDLDINSSPTTDRTSGYLPSPPASRVFATICSEMIVQGTSENHVIPSYPSSVDGRASVARAG